MSTQSETVAGRPYRVAEAYEAMTAGLLPYADIAAAFAGLLRRFAPRARNVLEVACGTGSLTLELARLGFRLKGLDRSPEMLALAETKAAASGLEVSFVHQDLRAPHAGPPMDAVVCFYGGLNFLASPSALRRGFESIHGALEPGGLFLFDQFSNRRMRTLFSGSDLGIFEGLTVATHSRCRGGGRVDHHVRFSMHRPDGTTRSEVELHRLRIHPFKEILALLRLTGFVLLRLETLRCPGAVRSLADDYVFVARKASGETEGPMRTVSVASSW